MTKILITGAAGMLGTEVSEIFEKDDSCTLFKTDVAELDITHLEEVEAYLEANEIDLIINCAAYTNVDDAEDSGASLNKKVNQLGVANLAVASGISKIPLFHISTDYVFDKNSKKSYKETATSDSGINAYGEAKRAGEQAALENNKLSYIFRTSWLYGKNGKNLVDTIMKLGSERDELAFVEDEIGSPTYTKDVAQLLYFVFKEMTDYEPGVYHAVNEGSCSRYEQARLILDLIGSNTKLGKTKLVNFERKAKIPNYSILENTKLPKMRSWELALTDYISSLNL